MPMAAISFTVKPALVMASAAVPNCVLHISVASCSTQPGCGNICVNSFCATETMMPCSLKIIERELVVRGGEDRFVRLDLEIVVEPQHPRTLWPARVDVVGCFPPGPGQVHP